MRDGELCLQSLLRLLHLPLLIVQSRIPGARASSSKTTAQKGNPRPNSSLSRKAGGRMSSLLQT